MNGYSSSVKVMKNKRKDRLKKQEEDRKDRMKREQERVKKDLSYRKSLANQAKEREESDNANLGNLGFR